MITSPCLVIKAATESQDLSSDWPTNNLTHCVDKKRLGKSLYKKKKLIVFLGGLQIFLYF